MKPLSTDTITPEDVAAAVRLPGWVWVVGSVAVFPEPDGTLAGHLITEPGIYQRVISHAFDREGPGTYSQIVNRYLVPPDATPRLTVNGVPDMATAGAMLGLLGLGEPLRSTTGAAPPGGPESWRVRQQGDGRWYTAVTRNTPERAFASMGEAAIAVALALGYWTTPRLAVEEAPSRVEPDDVEDLVASLDALGQCPSRKDGSRCHKRSDFLHEEHHNVVTGLKWRSTS